MEAQRIDYETPLPEMTPEAAPLDDSLAFPQDVENSLAPIEEDTSAAEAPQQTTMSRGYSDALDLINRQAQQQAATQQAVAEAATPDDRLPVIRPELADALGVLDYRDPKEGQRRQQAAAMGEILGLPEYEKVQLGAAPVNADGTVTIRRAQAVSPEANAAAAAKLQADQAAAASRYKAEQSALNPSFLDKLQQRWRVGREQAVDDQLAYRAMMGEVDYEKVKGQLDPSTAPLKGGNWLSEGVLTAAQMLPAMVDGIISGNTLGLKGAMTAGTAAAIAGQVGPQVVTPEEIVTVPAAAAVGYTAGTAAGSADYWYKQGAGSMYHQLRKEGVPHNVSSTVAASFGAPYAAIELAQVSKLVPGVKQTAAQAVAGGIKSRLTALAKEKGVEYVEQIGQETTQELLSISGEKLAEWSAGVTPPKDKASAWERIASTIQQTATSIPFLMAPKAAVDTYQTVRGNEQTATDAPPVEVPQNFTPISAPAAAPATTRPRSLGEVRAPQIAVDQAAIDEAFGSPFAPPSPAEEKQGINLQQISESVLIAFPDMTEAEGGLIPLSRFTPEEQASLRNSGIVESAQTSEGNTYEGVNSEYLWQRRKQFQDERAAKSKKAQEAAAPKPLPTDALPTETPGATYGREAEIYDAFANVRRVPLDIPPEASARVASATIAPELTGSPELIAGEGTSVSPPTPAAPEVVPSPQAGTTPEYEAEFAELRNLIQKRGQAENKIRGVRFSKKDEARFNELLPKYRSRIFETITPETDPVVWNDIENNPIKVSPKGTFYTLQNGRVRTGPAFAVSIGNATPQPISAETVESNNIPLPEGYTKQGELYVYQPAAPEVAPDSTPPPRPFSEIMAENIKRKGQAGYIDLGVVQDFGQSIYKAGMDFAVWAGRMVQKFGEAVRNVLSSLWQSISGGQYLPQARERGSVNISPGTGPKPRKFTQSVQAAEGVMPEVKAQLNSFEYDPVSNAETVAAARAGIDAAGSIDAAFTGLMGKTAAPEWQPTAVDYATGMELMSQLQNRGRHEDAGAIANMMANRATDQGRAIQALSMISRLGPQGIEVFAQRQLTQAATSGKTEKQRTAIQAKIDEADQLRGEVGKVRHGAATAAIVGNKDLIKGELPAGVDPVKVNLAIRDAIMGSPTPLAAEAATHKILTAEGLSDKGAVRISKSIVKDFLKTSQDARAKVLQDLQAAAENDRRLDKSKLGALMRLNREGKLTDASLHAGMAKMLGIPHWGAEQSAKVQRILAQRDRATDPRIKLVKAAEALDVVYREFMPPGILDKIDTYQTMAMLLNGITQVRNLVGNISMAGVEIASDTVAQALDAVVGLGTGKRTRTGLDLGIRLTELGAGFQDIRAGYQFARAEGKGRRESFKEGVQTLIRLGRIYSSGKYDSQELTRYTGPVFNNPVMQTLENTLGAALSLADRGFYESAFKASLQNRMRTAAQNGTPMLAPDPDMIEQARMDAARAIYQDENIASKAFSGIRRVLNANKRWGLGSMVLKYTQVPGSILVRGLEFTPINTIRVLYETVAPLLPRTVGRYHIGKDFDQKAFTEAFARSLVGTGFLATGYWLSHLGILSGGMDSDDENERELAKAEGWGPYHINISALQRAMVTGNFWTRQPRLRTDKVAKYDWLAPMSIGVAMGANMREGRDKILKDLQAGKRTSDFATTANWLLAAAGETAGVTTSAMNTVLEQPMLSNLNQLFVKAGHSDPISALVKTAADIPGTMIPTVVKQWARYEDNIVRETRDGYDGKLKFRQTVNELKAMLPGVSKTLPPRYDMEGNPVERFPNNGNTFFNVALNPAFVGYIKKSKLLSEMSDVYKATANGGVVPSRIPPKVSLEKVEITLMPDEISALQKEYGMLSVAAAEKFVFSDPYYEKATWEQRANALQKALTMAAKAAKYRVLQSRPDLYQRAKAEHIQRMESQRAANQQAQQDLAAVSQAMSQLQPGP